MEERLMNSTNKQETIARLSEAHTLALTRDAESWTEFLNSAAKMYKYPFADQVLIHAQRPDATACATIDLWNKTFRRWIRKGSKGIALIDDSEGTGKIRLKYVFDVSDTQAGRDGARPPYIWKMGEEHEAPVAEALKGAYEDCPEQGDLKSRILELSRNLAEAHAADMPGSEEDAKDKKILASSIGYVVLSRCGLDTRELAGNFEDIHHVSDLTNIANLGEAAGELAKDVLSRIENTVKRYERQKALEAREAREGSV